MFDLFENVIDLAQSKKTGGSGGSVELPFGETPRGTENLFEYDPEAYGGGGTRYLKDPKLNLNKSYDIIIRGDVYANVPCEKVHNYYEFAVWGTSAYGAEGAQYPFSLQAVWPWYDGDSTVDKSGNWDSDGNWIGVAGAIDSWGYPQIRVDTEKYPDLKPEEIEIYEPASITKMSGKFVEGMGWSEVVKKNEVLADNVEAAASALDFPNVTLKPGERYTVIWDGVRYENLECFLDVEQERGYIGSNSYDVFDEYPFQMYDLGKHGSTFYCADSNRHTVTVIGPKEVEVVHPIDQKFIVLTSPNGTQYNLSVADDGTLSAVAAT